MDRQPLDIDALRSALDARWARVRLVDETGSTNADLLADSAAPDRSLLVAESQTSGRGRLDRSWVAAPRTGLTFSTLWRPGVPTAAFSWLPLLAGVALLDAVTEITGLPVGLKWPNDLLSGSKKLAGILAQASGGAVVIGIGLNVSTTADELPVPTASSLALEGATALDRTALLVGIAAELDRRMTEWVAAGGDATSSGLRDAYLERCSTLGRDVTVTTAADGTFRGTAVGVDHAGRLELRVDDAVRVVGAGDVEHLRSVE